MAKSSFQENAKHGITGRLICKDGSVLEVLEGEKKTVLERFETIKNDSRISYALVMITRPAPEREFSNWSMGFANAAETDHTFDVTHRPLSVIFPKTTNPELDAIVKTFAQVNNMA